MTKRLAPVQKAYLTAKATCESAWASYNAVAKTWTSTDERHARFDTSEYQKYSAAYEALTHAENTLIQWGIDQAKHLLTDTDTAEVFEKVRTYQVGPEARQQLIDQIMKLVA